MICTVNPSINALAAWVISPEGQAAASWSSSIFSAFAIVIALFVFLTESSRNKIAIKREAQRDAAAATAMQLRDAETARLARESIALERYEFIMACIDTVVEAQAVTLKARSRLIVSEFVDTTPAGPLPHLLEPLLDRSHALQRAAPMHSGLAFTLARTTRTLKDLVQYRSLASTPPRSTFIDWVDERIYDLGEREASLRTILADLPSRYPDSNLPK